MTNQPKWRLVANLGDVNYLDYGGYFVYRDSTKVYTEEAEYLESPDSDDSNEPYRVYRFCLDRCKLVTVKGDPEVEAERNASWTYLVPFEYDETWPHPVASYDEWFHKYIEQSACPEIPAEMIREYFCSADPRQRAFAYRQIADYWGWDNFDSYPLSLTRAEAKKRYAHIRRAETARRRRARKKLSQGGASI